MTGKNIQQQMYTRERGGIFQANDGYDTIAKSPGLDNNFIKKYLHPICLYESPKSLIERSEKDPSLYPDTLVMIQPETGELVVGQSVYVAKDFTGQRSAFFMHNYVIPFAHKDEWLKAPEKLFQLTGFQGTYDPSNGQELPEVTNLEFEGEDLLAEKDRILAELGITETVFKQLLFAVMSSIAGKKKVYISLNVPLQEYNHYAKKLLGLIFYFLPYTHRRRFGALTFTAEPEGKKYINVMFFEPGTLNYGDRSLEKQFIFDFARNRISGVEIEGQRHEYLDYALAHFSQGKRMDRFFDFAETALSGLDDLKLELASYYELTAIYRTLVEKDYTFYEANKLGFLHGLLKFIRADLEKKGQLVELFAELLLVERFAKDSQTVYDFLRIALEFYRVAGGKNEAIGFILNTLIVLKESTQFRELWKLVEKEPDVYVKLLTTINTNEKLTELLDLYLQDRFKGMNNVGTILDELKSMLQYPILLKNERFILSITEKIADAFYHSGSSLKDAATVRDFSRASGGLEFVRFHDKLFHKIKRMLLSDIIFRQIKLEDLDSYGKIFTWNAMEKQQFKEDKSYQTLSALYDMVKNPPTSSAMALRGVDSTGRRQLRDALENMLPDILKKQLFRLFMIAFDGGGPNSVDYRGIFNYLGRTDNDKTVLAFISWADNENSLRNNAYKEELKSFLKRNWNNKELRGELKKIESKQFRMIMKNIQKDMDPAVIKFLRKNGLFVLLTAVILCVTVFLGYKLFFSEDKKPVAATANSGAAKVDSKGKDKQADVGKEAELITLDKFNLVAEVAPVDKGKDIVTGDVVEVNKTNDTLEYFLNSNGSKIPLNIPYTQKDGYQLKYANLKTDGKPPVILVGSKQDGSDFSAWIFQTGAFTQSALDPIKELIGKKFTGLKGNKLKYIDNDNNVADYTYTDQQQVEKQ